MNDEPKQDQESVGERLLSPNLKQIYQTLNNLLFKTDAPLIIAIKGGWGEGKTHFWKNGVAEKHPAQKIGYVSVFGAESLAAIRNEVVVEAMTSWAGTGNGLNKMIKKVYPMLGKLGHAGTYIASKFGLSEIPIGVPTQIMEHVVFREGWVLCIDDIERLPRNIELDALLGYINSLRDERKLNVVLIYNENKVEEDRKQDSLDRYLEKVVDRELVFAPDIKEILSLVLAPEISDAKTLLELEHRCEALNFRNIRILKRLKLYYSELVAALPDNADAEFLKAAIYSLLLFSWVKFSRDDAGQLTFEYLSGYSHIAMSMKRYARVEAGQGDDGDPQEKLLNEYGYIETDDFDLILMDFVQTSVLDAAALNSEYEKYIANTSRGKLEQDFNDVWLKFYHGTLKNTEKEFCDGLVRTTNAFMDYIQLHQIDGVLVRLSVLDRKKDADSLLDEFRSKRPEVFEHYDASSLINPIEFDSLLEALEEGAEISAIDNRPLSEVINSAVEKNYIRLADRQRLAQFSAQDFVNHFTSNDQDHLTTTIRKLAKLSTQDDEFDTKIHDSIMEAASIIAGQSRLNRMRMESMGLVEPPPV